MYVIISYDIKSIKCQNVLKILRKYLFHIHESVFEGEISELTFYQMKAELMNTVNEEEGSIMFYILPSDKMLKKETIGKPICSKFII